MTRRGITNPTDRTAIAIVLWSYRAAIARQRRRLLRRLRRTADQVRAGHLAAHRGDQPQRQRRHHRRHRSIDLHGRDHARGLDQAEHGNLTARCRAAFVRPGRRQTGGRVQIVAVFRVIQGQDG